MNDAELYALIQSDADAKTKADIGDDSGCAARCSEIAPTIRQPVDAASLRKTLAILGRWGGLARVANNFESPDPPYQQARTLIDLITAGDSIDLDEPAIAEGAPILVAHQLLSATDLQTISALGDKPQIISPAQVSEAMRPYRGGV
jgi:hypothetical protein